MGHIFVPEQKLYFSPFAQWLETSSHMLKLFFEQFRKSFTSLDLGQLMIMPRVTSFDVRAAIWAHHQNGLSGQNISDKLSLDGMCAWKRGVNKIIREITCQTIWWLNDWNRSPPSHPQHMEKYRECWWSLMLQVTCEWTAEGFSRVSWKKSQYKMEENLSTEASTWRHVRCGNQRL